MMSFRTLALLLTTATLLQGCATAVVTGAATGATLAVERRTTGTVIDDQGIEFKAARALHEDQQINDQSHINVTSYNGLLLVTGETLTEDLKYAVTKKLQAIPKVRRVHNELIIGAPSAITSRTSDAWITSKVLAKLAANENINHFHVKVVTENSVVYLMGILTTAEADQVVDVVKTSAGVQRVVKIFEYMN
jgi:osmotically-inducible protein OsmY